MMQKDELLRQISSNIESNGYHVTVVTGGDLPRFAYTIGCNKTLGSEFVFAGGEFYSQDDVWAIIKQVILFVKKKIDWQNLSIEIDSLGKFSIVKADDSWIKLMALGAFDYYRQSKIKAWQIIPDQHHITLDTPDMSQIFEAASQPVWQWLSKKWPYPIPNNVFAITNLEVLFGKKATEVMRWEEDEWEIFSEAASDIPKKNMRIVPLATLIGIDISLEPVINLKIGKGFWRDSIELEWNSWG